MEGKKKMRKIYRSNFTKLANELEQLLTDESADSKNVQACWVMLQEKFDSLRAADKEIWDSLLIQDTSEEDLAAEMDSCDNYLRKFSLMKASVSCGYKRASSEELEEVRPVVGSISNVEEVTGRRKFKLPCIEFKKFSGDIRDWLSFWGQFKKVHDDPDIDLADKIEYLIQATAPGSRARQLVESFPAMGENYLKIIDSLKSRFGRDELQIEVYVRELLKLILNNSWSKNKLDLSTLYDRIETQLRSLETLGITTDKCAAMLFPLIESCLPEELIRIWQRSSEVFKSREGEQSEGLYLKRRLDNLMTFLKHEADNEQRISLAAEGFGLCSISEKGKVTTETKYGKSKVVESVIPTAAGLVNFEEGKCVFCHGTHESVKCFKAQKMTLDEKREKLAQSKACFKCLKPGHLARRCHNRFKCLVCSQFHMTLMCPDLPAHKNNQSDKVETTLANCNSTYVFLQTLKVIVDGKQGPKEMHILLDTGSQRSYILKSSVVQLGYQPKVRENGSFSFWRH